MTACQMASLFGKCRNSAPSGQVHVFSDSRSGYLAWVLRTGKRHDGLDSYGTTFIGRQMLWMGVHEHSR